MFTLFHLFKLEKGINRVIQYIYHHLVCISNFCDKIRKITLNSIIYVPCCIYKLAMRVMCHNVKGLST